MIVSNIHILSFESLYEDIIRRDSLPYDYKRLNRQQVLDLRQRCFKILEDVSKAILGRYPILWKDVSHIAYISSNPSQGFEIPSEYKDIPFTHKFYPIGAVDAYYRYALWDGSSLVTRNAIMCRKDYPDKYKEYFSQLMKSILLSSSRPECTSDDRYVRGVHATVKTLCEAKIK